MPPPNVPPAGRQPPAGLWVGLATAMSMADRELMSTRKWPLRSYLEVRALPAAVRFARLHAKNVLHEWEMAALADTVELLVSEIITNAVHVSASRTRQQGEAGNAAGAQPIRFWLTSDRCRVMIQVWDGDHHQPIPQDAGLDAETGRGLLLVETLSAQWGCYAPDRQGGKIVWAMCAPQLPPAVLPAR
jgi:Histidine kinase-like ATPase domain